MASATRVVELATPGRASTTSVGQGIRETSGIIDGSGLFGRGTWRFDVQAHPPPPAPVMNTVEDGKLMMIKPRWRGHDSGDDRE